MEPIIKSYEHYFSFVLRANSPAQVVFFLPSASRDNPNPAQARVILITKISSPVLDYCLRINIWLIEGHSCENNQVLRRVYSSDFFSGKVGYCVNRCDENSFP